MSAKHDPEFLDWFNQSLMTSDITIWPIYAAGRVRLGPHDTHSRDWTPQAEKRPQIHAARRMNIGSHCTFVTTPLRELSSRTHHARMDILSAVKPK